MWFFIKLSVIAGRCRSRMVDGSGAARSRSEPLRQRRRLKAARAMLRSRMKNPLLTPRQFRAEAARLREMAMNETDRYVRAELIAAAGECGWVARELIRSGAQRSRGPSSNPS
jgi:hypothetical protein